MTRHPGRGKFPTVNTQSERTRPWESVGREHHATAGALAAWILEEDRAIADRWRDEIRARSGDIESSVLDAIGEALDLMVSLLPSGLSAQRERAEALLREVAELYGTFGANRGLAAGEAVEEIQLLREVIVRFLYGRTPTEGSRDLDLRDLLQLNRLIDLIVTFASVGHTDRLFFSLIDGPGVSVSPEVDVVAAFREHIRAFRDEASELASA